MKPIEWLQTFCDLADQNASTLEFRSKLKLRAQNLPSYIRKLPEYRKELAQLKKLENLEKARAAAVKKKAEKKALKIVKAPIKQILERFDDEIVRLEDDYQR